MLWEFRYSSGMTSDNIISIISGLFSGLASGFLLGYVRDKRKELIGLYREHQEFIRKNGHDLKDVERAAIERALLETMDDNDVLLPGTVSDITLLLKTDSPSFTHVNDPSVYPPVDEKSKRHKAKVRLGIFEKDA